VLWYVDPAYRHGRVGPSLFWHLYQLCLTNGITQFRVVQPYDRPRWAKWLKRMGFQPIEVGWLLSLPSLDERVRRNARSGQAGA
jgi:N-acetylglutamate synthase-like GNAT family acetyltransferase